MEIDNSFNNNTESTGYCAVQSVMKNKEGFTKRQVEQANKARSGYHMAGAPDLKAFKMAIRAGLFKNCPIEESDVMVAQKIYGPSASVLKGKTKRPTPEPVINDWIEIPEELVMHNTDLDLCVDLAFINNVVALTGVDKQIKYRHFIELSGRTKKALFSGIDEIFRLYNHAGFNIRRIFCDLEFKPLFDEVMDELNVHMNYASAGEHEPTAERNIQHLKSIARTLAHRTFFKRIPKQITVAIGRSAARTSNFYPAKGGISEYYSPHMIIAKRQVDYEREFVAEIGSFVQAYGHETHRNQASRTMDGIYLGPTPNSQSGHKILNLATGETIRRTHVKALPMTKQVIDTVEQMASDENVKELRTYSRRTGAPILDADLLTGVDLDELYDEDYEDEYDSNEDNPPKRDENLRNEQIDDEEVNDLIDDLDEFIITENDFDDYEDEVVERIIQRMRQRRINESDSEDDDKSEQSQQQKETTPNKDRNDAEFMLDLTHELEELENQESSINKLDFIINDEGKIDVLPKQKDDDSVEEQLDDVPELIKRNNKYDTDDDSDDEDDTPILVTKQEVRKLRSGKAYWQDGVKMRPTVRNGNERLKFSAYMKSKKKKSNSKKNRSAMRRKERISYLKSALQAELNLQRKSRRATPLAVKRRMTNIKNVEQLHNLMFQQTESDQKEFYARDHARLIARVMTQIRNKVMNGDGVNFIQQYYITKGLKKFGNKDGKEAAMKELQQMVDRNCWEPKLVSELTPEEKKKAVEAMMLLAEKNDGTIKGRYVYKGNDTRDWMTREETSSPTASLEGIITTSVIDAHEERDVMSVDIPNAFIQTHMPDVGEFGERTIMKITGLLVDYLLELDPSYRKFVVRENGRRVIYVVVLRAIYGMLIASLLFYKKLRADLEGVDFEFNPYDPCIANRVVDGKQQTIKFHVDDLMSSHVDPKVNDKFYLWMDEMYGKYKKVTCTRGKIHTYLGMTLDFTKKGKVKIRMDDYVTRMLNEFPRKFNEGETQETPAGGNLFEPGKGGLLEPERKEIFHSFVAKSLFLSKRARLDIGPTVAALASRVREPTQGDWKKLVRMMRYLYSTQGMHLSLRAYDLHIIKWYIDASFAVHPDFKSHTGSTATMGEGVIQTMSRKQKLNSRSSTEAELIAVDDAITQVLWTKLFMEAQGYPVEENILYQDNMSSILLETNGRSSAGKRSRALNIRYFFVTDQVELGNVKIEHMPTDDMWADYMTKPLQGDKFRKFRALILGDQD